MVEKKGQSIKMLRLVLGFVCICLTQSAPQLLDLLKLDGRIVGGEGTFIEEHPYQISLLYYSSHRCGGVVISEEFVLTAAHCTFG